MKLKNREADKKAFLHFIQKTVIIVHDHEVKIELIYRLPDISGRKDAESMVKAF